jgi:hypothetical protein
VLPTPVGYEKWEWAGFPKGHPEIFVQVRPPVIPGPAEALPEPEIYTCLAEALSLVPDPPASLFDLAEHALEPEGAAAYLAELQSASRGNSAALLFWGYRTLGPKLPAPALVAVWAQCHENAFVRRDAVLRMLGDDWKGASPFEIAAELFRRILDHPEGVEIARVATDTNLEDHVGWEDGRGCAPGGRQTPCSAIRAGGRAGAPTASSTSSRPTPRPWASGPVTGCGW